jgi:hypothetical protein
VLETTPYEQSHAHDPQTLLAQNPERPSELHLHRLKVRVELLNHETLRFHPLGGENPPTHKVYMRLKWFKQWVVSILQIAEFGEPSVTHFFVKVGAGDHVSSLFAIMY